MSVQVNANVAKKSKAHTQYRTSSGLRVPGVTTITGVMDKPALVRWANQLGLQGIDTTKYVDEMATIGTLAHYLIQSHLEGVKPDLSDYTPNQIALAETGLIKFMYWQQDTGYEPIWCERVFVSEQHLFGGTVDGYGVLKKRGDRKVLLDIKTAKAIYDDMFTQVAGGYGLLLQEHGVDFSDVLIIRVGRNDDEGERPEEKRCTNVPLHQRRFLVCRALYALNNEIRKGM